MAVECEAADGLHLNEDHFLVEALDGELVITTLTKEALPLIRYRTADVATVTEAPCACGRTLARMSPVQGRRDDMLILRGVNVYPSEIEHVLLGVEGVEPHYELTVERPGASDEVRVRCEAGGDRAGVARARARRAARAHRARHRGRAGRARHAASQRGQGGAGDRPALGVTFGTGIRTSITCLRATPRPGGRPRKAGSGAAIPCSRSAP